MTDTDKILLYTLVPTLAVLLLVSWVVCWAIVRSRKCSGSCKDTFSSLRERELSGGDLAPRDPPLERVIKLLNDIDDSRGLEPEQLYRAKMLLRRAANEGKIRFSYILEDYVKSLKIDATAAEYLPPSPHIPIESQGSNIHGNNREGRQKTGDNINQRCNPSFQDRYGKTTNDKLEIPIVVSECPDVELLNNMLGTIDNWQFDSFEFARLSCGRPLSQMSLAVARRWHVFSTLGINERTFCKFVLAVEAGMPENPYHNRIHVTDVLQGMNLQLAQGGLDRVLNGPVDIFCCIVTAVIHDFQHPGLNNDFLVCTRHPIAILYNDKSVLENSHVAAAFQLIMEENLDLLASFSLEQGKHIRKMMVDMVLATDMKDHFLYLDRFEKLEISRDRDFWKKLSDTKSSNTPAIKEPRNAKGSCERARGLGDGEVLLIAQLAIKVADLVNLSRQFAVHQKWVQCLIKEFYCQGEVERHLGIPPSPSVSSAKGSVPMAQIAFFNMFALRLFEVHAKILPQCAPLFANVAENLKHWELISETKT